MKAIASSRPEGPWPSWIRTLKIRQALPRNGRRKPRLLTRKIPNFAPLDQRGQGPSGGTKRSLQLLDWTLLDAGDFLVCFVLRASYPRHILARNHRRAFSSPRRPAQRPLFFWVGLSLRQDFFLVRRQVLRREPQKRGTGSGAKGEFLTYSKTHRAHRSSLAACGWAQAELDVQRVSIFTRSLTRAARLSFARWGVGTRAYAVLVALVDYVPL